MDEERDFTALIRLRLLQLLTFVFVLVIFGRLYQLQIVRGAEYRNLAARNRLRELSIPAPRGIIYDRNNIILVRNQPRFQVSVVPADLPKDPDTERAMLHQLFTLLRKPATSTTTPTAVPEASNNAPYFHFSSPEALYNYAQSRLYGASSESIVVADSIPQETAFILSERNLDYPGVHVRVRAVRDYPTGALTAPIIGYMGAIPSVRSQYYLDRGYRLDDRVGIAGLEYSYEDMLRGRPGKKYSEVDVLGREVRTLGVAQEAKPGDSLVLTLDLNLQKIATEALQKELNRVGASSGAVVAMNPNNGAILALVSRPSFDNNWFAGGISVARYKALLEDRWHPLVDKAISGIYPPGSTFKIVPASAALQEGTLKPDTYMKGEAILVIPNKYFPNDMTKAQIFYDWIYKYNTDHGYLNVSQALAVSCDTFFYKVGGGYQDYQGLGINRLDKYARLFGFGAPTGISLPGESAGLVPSAKWKRLNYAESWVTGDTYNMSIGQGFMEATPLQMLNATVAVANGGKLWQPQIVYQVRDASGKLVRDFQPKLIRQLPIEPKYLQLVREGMYGAVNWPRGTALNMRIPGLTIAGKTGTAEFAVDADGDGRIDRDKEGNLPTHAWFTAFAPYKNPQIVLVVFVYGGGEGSAVAVPVAREIMKAYFHK